MSTLSPLTGDDRRHLSRRARLFTAMMTDSARESVEFRRQIAKRITAVGLVLRLDGLGDREGTCFTEAYARSLIGGIVALYLDRFGPEQRGEAKLLLLAAADAISESLACGGQPRRGKRSNA